MLYGSLMFFGSFFAVFFLALNSKFLRDDHILLGSIVSWLITIAQYALTWVVVHSPATPMEFIVLAGAGGSAGTTLAQYFYRWLQKFHLPNRPPVYRRTS